MGVVMSLETFYTAPKTLRKFQSSPLANMLDGFCGYLQETGHSRISIYRIMSDVSHLTYFFETKNRNNVDVLSKQDIDMFLKVYLEESRNQGQPNRRRQRVQWSLHRFVKYLQQIGCFESQTEHPIFESILKGYLKWMRDYRHVAQGTLRIRQHYICKFLDCLGEKATYQGIEKLTPETIEQFFLLYAQNAGPEARHLMQAALRTFLRFCFQNQLVPHPLDKAVPKLHTYKLATVPRGLTPQQVQKVFDCVNRNTDVGRRDYAMLQLLYTYGVRGAQVRYLQLTDIYWKKNQILFRATKRGKDSLLPLTEVVGRSLLDYLKGARPDYTCPEVFLTSKAPYHRLTQSRVLSGMVRRYIIKAGINIPCKGAYTLRHCFATRMVQAGHPLKSVADVLGHRYLSTTFVYTKVNFNALKQVALEWPGEVL